MKSKVDVNLHNNALDKFVIALSAEKIREIKASAKTEANEANKILKEKFKRLEQENKTLKKQLNQYILQADLAAYILEVYKEHKWLSTKFDAFLKKNKGKFVRDRFGIKNRI